LCPGGRFSAAKVVNTSSKHAFAKLCPAQQSKMAAGRRRRFADFSTNEHAPRMRIFMRGEKRKVARAVKETSKGKN